MRSLAGLAIMAAVSSIAVARDHHHHHEKQLIQLDETMKLADDPKCPDNASKVTSLPFWRSSDPFPCMYSGTLKSSTSLNHNLFYWLFKNQEKVNPALVLWLNGGPGSSSMFGLFMENGPLRVSMSNSADPNTLQIGLPQVGGSWADDADMLFLDQPVGTGFSYGDSYVNSMQTISDEMLNFLVNFIFTMYPEYQTRDLIITGESYAGKYLPQLATTIHRYNLAQQLLPQAQQKILNLKAALIGDPFVSPVRQRMSTHLIAQDVGIIEPVHLRQIQRIMQILLCKYLCLNCCDQKKLRQQDIK